MTRHGDRLAVRSRSGDLSYGELNRAANRLAHAVLSRRDDAASPVAVYLSQGTDEIVATLGVVKAGRPFVALSQTATPARLARVLGDSTATAVVASTRTVDRLRRALPESVDVILLDALDAGLSVANPSVPLAADTLACISYTSGSTGEPKGVMQTHRSIAHRVLEFTDGGAVGPEDRLSFLVSGSYSAFLRQVFGALLNGAALCAFDVGAQGADELVTWVVRERINIYVSVSSVFRQFARALTGGEDLSALRLTRLFGEPLTREDVELHRQRLPSHCALLNALSANEAGTIAEWIVPRSEPLNSLIVPCGFPLEDTEVFLVDGDDQRVGAGEEGEILVRSRYLSPGYWRRPELTRAAFLPDPEGGDARIYRTGDLGRFRADGCLESRGRRDFRVKIRGLQVEVADVEAGLRELGARDAVVVERKDGAGEARLVAYVVPHERPAPTTSALRRELGERLPEHMVPSVFVVLDALPLNANGKVDRQSLPAPSGARPELDTEFVAPRTPVEAELARIWAEVLQLDAVGVDDHFLELGGHSLLATHVVSRVIHRFAVDVPLRALFEAPTVAAMAVVIVGQLAMQVGDEEMSRVWADVEGARPSRP